MTELLTVKDLRQFQDFLSLCAARAGQLLNLSALANQAGISQPTAKSWFSELESSYITFQLHPFQKNFSNRVVKTPKLYFDDPGLLAFLLKIKTRGALLTQPVKGALFENMIIAEFHKLMHHQYRDQSPWFWWDNRGNEVDLLVDQGLSLDVYEIKATETILTEHFKGLEKSGEISDIPLTAKRLM